MLQDFLEEHDLSPQFLQVVEQWYAPLVGKLAAHAKVPGSPLVVGLNGSQGSGKSTLASLLCKLLSEQFQLKTVTLSIDDFYLGHETRLHLAKEIHPLLATRGVPGTHDVPLMREILLQLTGRQGKVLVPRFNKANDDRQPIELWDKIELPLDIIIIEGWCLGTPSQPEGALGKAVNQLEKNEDPDGSWREYVNQQLHNQYKELHQIIDIWIMLQAPSFDCVYRWRLEQEKKLAATIAQNSPSLSLQNRVMNAKQIWHFIQHYQRLTEHSLRELPGQVNYLFKLDQNRRIIKAIEQKPVMLR